MIPHIGRDLALQLLEFLLIRREIELRIGHLDGGFVLAIEEGKQPIVFPLLERIELVIVALGATNSHTQPNRPCRGHPIKHAIDAELFLIDPALLVDLRVAVKPGGHDLFLGRTREEIPG